MPHPTVTIEKVLSRTGTALMVGVGLAAIAFAWWGMLHVPRRNGLAHSQRAVAQYAQELDHELRHAELIGEAVAQWWEVSSIDPKDPLSLESVRPFLYTTALVREVLLAEADGNRIYFIRHTPAGWGVICLERHGESVEKLRDRAGRWVSVKPSAFERAYQPSSRPWFRFGKGLQKGAWYPEVYQFTSDSSGFTYVAPIRTASGTLKGLVGIDISLQALEDVTHATLPPDRFQVHVTDGAARSLVPWRERGAAPPPGWWNRASIALDPVLLQQGAYPAMRIDASAAPGAVLPGLFLRLSAVLLLAVGASAFVYWHFHRLRYRLAVPLRHLATTEGGETSDIFEIRKIGQSMQLMKQTKRDHQALLGSLEHLQRVDSVGLMASGIIHDACNQLTAARAQMELVEEELAFPWESTGHFDKAKMALSHCGNLLKTLLSYARKSDDSDIEWFDLKDVIKASIILLKPALGSGIRIEVDLSHDCPAVSGNLLQMEQVIVNLCLNARDAMPDGGTLRLRCRRKHGQAVLEVEDSGTGMSESTIERIFDPFYTTKAAGKGTGLGLSMVANIVGEMGGQIQVTSQPGLGTKFEISFPPAQAPDSTPA
ncbi:MAG: sensor histidine kinase [Acidobacteria bacterium]|nr:sensor histidine kinase [Acidobacteriota bacterium]MBI3487022.1 sensor histidine kinase [Acidobacteriota bacterium]